MEDDDVPSLEQCLSKVCDEKTKAAVLLSAVRLARYNCIRVLVAAGSDPLLKLDGVNAMICAIRKNDVKSLLLLVDHQLPRVVNKKPVEVSRSWYDDRKPADEALFIAAELANVEAVNVLLEVGANPNGCFFYDDELLVTCSTLVEACLAPSRRLPADNVLANAEAVVHALVNAGANVNRRCSTGKTPLHWAVNSGLLQSLMVLVAAGADVNEQRGSNDGWTALMMAAYLQSDHGLAAVTTLLSAGADIDFADHYHFTALCHAVTANSLPIAEYLLEQGANPDGCGPAVPFITTTPLYLATSVGNRAMVVLLLKWGANVNLTVETIPSRCTVFDVALRVNNFELVAVFLAAGADRARAYKLVCENIDAICSKVPVGMTDLLSLDDRIRLQRLQKLHGELSEPQTLKQLCRVTIRRYAVGRRRLSDLPLPSTLQLFLSFDDL